MSSPRKAEAGPFARELAAALAAAQAAATRALELYAVFEAVPNAHAAISLPADREVQDLILERLAAEFPADAFTAEEKTPTLDRLPRRGPRRWIIDPIDGTRGFAKKNGEFSVMIGLVADGAIQVGVVAEPTAARLTHAVRGQGCWTRIGEVEERCAVTTVERIEEATILASHGARRLPSPELEKAPRRLHSYSAGLKLALVARGGADLYWREHVFHSWDLCAGQILVEEAGGRVTDAAGRPIDYTNMAGETIEGVLASNGRLDLHFARAARR